MRFAFFMGFYDNSNGKSNKSADPWGVGCILA